MAEHDQERREYPRYVTDLPIRIHHPAGEFMGQMLNISGGGALLRVDPICSSLLADSSTSVQCHGIGSFPIIQRWRQGGDIGVGFLIGDAQKQTLALALAQKFGANSNSPPQNPPRPAPQTARQGRGKPINPA